MPAYLQVPPTVPYNGTLFPTGIANATSAPPEGPMAVTAGVNWTVDGNALLINLAQNGSVFSQIAGVYVNNASCSQPVTVICQDTQYQLVVPAYSAGWYPVYTRLLQIVVWNPTAIAGDQTFFQFYNSLVANPSTANIFEKGAVANAEVTAFPATAGSINTVTIVNSPCIVRAVDFGIANILGPSTGTFVGAVRLYDGSTATTAQLVAVRFGVNTNQFIPNQILLSHSNIDIPVTTSLILGAVMGSGNALSTGSAFCNVLYTLR